MCLAEILVTLVLIFIACISFIVAGIFIYIYLILLQKASELGETFLEYLERKNNKGSGN